MKWAGRIIVGVSLVLAVFLMGALTRSGFVPSPGSTAIWKLPPTDSTGCFRSDGSGNVTIVSCVAGAGTGDFSSNTAASVANEIVLFADATGKLGKRSTGSGIVTLTSGQLGTRTPPSGAFVGDTDTQVMTNKDVVRRSVTLTDAPTVTINADTTDIGVLLSLSQNTLFANPTTGTSIPNGKPLIVRIKSSAVRTLTWGTEFRGTAAFPLPTATSGGSLTDYIAFIRNLTDSKWDFQPMATGF